MITKILFIMKKMFAFILIGLFINLPVFAQSVESVEKEIEKSFDLLYYKGIEIDSKKNITLSFSANPQSLEETSFNLVEMDILGVEKSEESKYGSPLGVYRVLMECKTGDCVFVKEYRIDGDKKLLTKRYKNNTFWIYFDSYSNAENVRKLFEKIY